MEMKRFGIISIVVMLAGALMPGPVSVAGHLLGTSDGGMNLYDVNHTTGLATNGRGLDGGFAGIAFNPTQTLYGITSSEYIYSIAPGDGAGTYLSYVGVAFGEGDLDFDPISGTLYAVGFDTNALFTLNPLNGSYTHKGFMTGIVDASAMAFDGLGKLYVIDSATDMLHEINPSNANVLSSVPLSLALGDLIGMDFDPQSGMLFVADGGAGSTDMLFTLDTGTGALTSIGTTRTGGLSGLAFVVPEPATLLFAGLGLLGLVARRRYR